jgi:hypothetical protein
LPGTTKACASDWLAPSLSGESFGMVLTEAFAEPHRELGIDMPLEALVSLVMTFNIGIIVERLGGVDTGHAELLEWIDQWLSS